MISSKVNLIMRKKIVPRLGRVVESTEIGEDTCVEQSQIV